KRCASLAASSGTASSPESSVALCGSQGLTSNGGSMSNDSSSDFGTSWASNELSDRLTIATYATTHFVRRQSRIGEPRALTLYPDLFPVTRVFLERGLHLNKGLLPAHVTVFRSQRTPLTGGN